MSEAALPKRKRLGRPRWMRVSGKPTAVGWALMGIGLSLFFAALNSGNNLLYILVAMILSLTLTADLLHFISVGAVRLRIELPPVVTAEEPFWFSSVFENKSRWRNGYLLSCDPGRGVKPKGALKMSETRWLPLIEPKKQAVLWQQAVAAKRGVYEIDEAFRVSRAPYGIFLRRRPFAAHERLVVLPAPYSVDIPPLRGPNEQGAQSAPRAGEGFDLRTIRPYESGESARKIAWRASARAGNLLVKENEEETRKRVRLVLEGATPALSAAFVDRQAGAARYVAQTFVRLGYLVRLEVPGAPIPADYAVSESALLHQLVPLASWSGEAAAPASSEPGVPCVRVLADGKILWPAAL